MNFSEALTCYETWQLARALPEDIELRFVMPGRPNVEYVLSLSSIRSSEPYRARLALSSAVRSRETTSCGSVRRTLATSSSSAQGISSRRKPLQNSVRSPLVS
jgi:hypothetical protein